MSNRTKGTIIHQLNPEALGEAIAKKTGKTNAEPTYEYALGEGRDGTALICSEGVGWYVKETIDLDASVRTPNEKGYTLSWTEVPFTLEELRAIPSEPVDLADFVRVFGDRLERNFYIWQNELAK